VLDLAKITATGFTPEIATRTLAHYLATAR
jgi:hypothetical protein